MSGAHGDGDAPFLRRLAGLIERLLISLERAEIADYVALYEHPARLLWYNFMAGVARGIGTAVGFTLLGALFIQTLRWFNLLNLPVIGRLVAEIVKIVNRELGYH
ncbi:MAG: hypothetical protein IRZ18_04925 [Clostridia bacterium]|nr:hypothetical protein [Clostridia bacterium]